MRRSAAVVLVATSLLIAACSSGTPDRSAAGSTDPPTTARRLTVVVTTPILADVVSAVAGDRADVTALFGRGDDPLTTTPTAGAEVPGDPAEPVDLTVAVDPATYDSAAAAALPSARQAIVAVDVVDAHRVDGSPDPRLWLDPDRLTSLAHELGRALAAAEGSDPSSFEAAADAYGLRLAGADEQVQATLAPLTEAQRRLATDDDRLGYLADRYDLTLVRPTGSSARVLEVDVDRLGPAGSPTGTAIDLFTSTASAVATWATG